MEEKFISVTETARRLGLTRQGVFALLAAGKIRAEMRDIFGGVYYVEVASVVEYAQAEAARHIARAEVLTAAAAGSLSAN